METYGVPDQISLQSARADGQECPGTHTGADCKYILVM